MGELNSKLEKMRRQIDAAAEAEAKKLIGDAEKKAKAMLDEETEIIEKEKNRTALAKASKAESDARKRVSESKFTADRKVLLHRNSLVNSLFYEIGAELSDFAASDRYKAHLEKCAELADSQEKLTAGTAVYCRRKDSDTAQEVLKKYGIRVETDRNITLGGLIFKYPEKGIFIDLTLDSAFEAQREAFSARSEMQL